MIDTASQGTSVISAEKLESESVFTQVAAELASCLPPEIAERLPAACDSARRILLTEMRSNPELFAANNPEATLRACLAIALGDRWNVTKHKFWARPRDSQNTLQDLSNEFLSLVLPFERLYVDSDEPVKYGASPRMIGALLKHAYPEAHIDLDQEDLTQILTRLAIDGIIILPHTTQGHSQTATDFMEAAYKSEGIPTQDGIFRFHGLADRRSGVVIVWKDTDEWTKRHEKNHADNPGMVLGQLGLVFEEAITELLTTRELHVERYGGGYRGIVELVNNLMKLSPEFRDAAYDYYRQHTSVNAFRFIKTLIAIVGWDDLLNLFTAAPDNYEVINRIRRDVYLRLKALQIDPWGMHWEVKYQTA